TCESAPTHRRWKIKSASFGRWPGGAAGMWSMPTATRASRGLRDETDGLASIPCFKDASRRKFDIVMAWAIDRLGRSLSDLLDTIQHLEACGVDLYLDQQAIDTTTPMGRLVFQLTGQKVGPRAQHYARKAGLRGSERKHDRQSGKILASHRKLRRE